MKQIAKSKKETLWVFAMLLMLLVFNACSNDDESDDATDDSSTINNTELTINDYLLIATGQETLYDVDGNVLSSINEGEDY